jgi:hypothetical protein
MLFFDTSPFKRDRCPDFKIKYGLRPLLEISMKIHFDDLVSTSSTSFLFLETNIKFFTK